MKIAVLGAGAMGQILKTFIEDSPHELTAIIDPLKKETLDRVPDETEVLIDFSHPANLSMMKNWALSRKNSGIKTALVIATTGYSEEDRETIASLGEEIPVVHSSNYSLGINVLVRVLSQITPILEESFDLEILEKHHNKKLDAPSGTAIMLQEAMDPKNQYEHVYGRSGHKRRGKEIGVNAIRGGNIAGEHTVIYAGEDEIIEITHKAGSKKIFALGALKACEFALQAEPGLYNMSHVLENIK